MTSNSPLRVNQTPPLPLPENQQASNTPSTTMKVAETIIGQTPESIVPDLYSKMIDDVSNNKVDVEKLIEFSKVFNLEDLTKRRDLNDLKVAFESVIQKYKEQPSRINTYTQSILSSSSSNAEPGLEELTQALGKIRDAVQKRDENGHAILNLLINRDANTLINIQNILAFGANLAIHNIDGNTPLCFAALNKLTPVLNALIAGGANVNTPNSINGCTPLLLAASYGHTETVTALLAAGATINTADNDRETPLSRAALSGHSSTVDALITAGATVNTQDKDGDTPLTNAINNGYNEIAKTLLAHGAAVNVRIANGETPLSIATNAGNTEVVELLLAYRVDVNGTNSGGASALGIAAWQGYNEIAQLLLDNGAAVEFQNKYGNTPLLLAAENGNRTIVQMLLEKNAKIDGTNNWGATALHLAAMSGKTDVVTTLIAAGAHVDLLSNNNNTPLKLASEGGHTEIVKALLAAHANVHIATKKGNTPLAVAALNGHTNIVIELLNAGALVNVRNNNGETPLMQAAMGGHGETMQLLLTKNADIDQALYQTAISSPKFHHLVRYIVEHPDPALQEFLQACFQEKFKENWQPNDELFTLGASINQYFLYREDPENSAHFHIHTLAGNVSIPKSSLYQYAADSPGDISFRFSRLITTTQKVEIELNRAELDTQPEALLHSVFDKSQRAIQARLRVRFIGESGVDIGGPSRQFIHELFSHLCTKMNFEKCDSDLMRPVSELPLSAQDQITYNQLGALIQFCLAGKYPIGMIFDPGVLAALRLIAPERPLENRPFEELFNIFKELYKYNESDQKMIEQMQSSLTPEEMRIDYILPKLIPIYEIARGMRNARFQNASINFNQICALDLQNFSAQLQGVVSKNDILTKLFFHADVTREVGNFFIKWIEEADDEKLKEFLFAVSGSTALGDSAKIIVCKGPVIEFHTCGHQLDLDVHNIHNESDLAERLDVALTFIKTTPHFDLM